MERLQKVIAQSGIASRRAAELLISEGKVRVNGKVVHELGTSVDRDVDVVLVNNRPLPKPSTVTYALHKPRGVVSSTKRQAKEQLVIELVPPYPKVYPVGRLDRESEGLILLSNDGALTQRVTHPGKEQEKEYRVTCRWEKDTPVHPPEWIAHQLTHGVKLGDGVAKAESVQAKILPDGDILLIVTVHEGRHHLIRRMCARIGLDVRRLQRLRIGRIELGRLRPGQFRLLTPEEVTRLQ